MDTSIIKVDKIVPDEKDIMRAENLSFRHHSFYGSGAPFGSEASKMAKVIKDPYKLVRRAKAVINRWGTRDYTGYSAGVPKRENVWIPFREALINMGFSWDQVHQIERG